MKITEELVDYVSELSRLKLPEGEKAAMAAELEKIVDYMDVLSGLDTTGVEPLSHVFPVKNVLRADEIQPSYGGYALLSGAPSSDGEAFVVPWAVE